MEKKSITKNYIYNLIYQILILILPLVTTPYLSRVLGATGIGIYSYTFSIMTYFTLFGALGVSLYGQREIAYAQNNPKERKRIFIEIVSFRFITIFIALIVYYFACIKNNEYQVYYTILIFEILATAFEISWFFQGIEDFKKTVTRNVLVRVISVTLVFLIIKTETDLIKFFTIYSVADFIGNVLLWFYLPRYFKGIKVKNINIKRHLMPIIMLFIPQIASQIYNVIDKSMIGKMIADKAEVGYYEQGQKVVRVLLTIVTSLGVVMVPRMASTFAEGNKEKVRDYMKKSFNFVFLLSFPMMFGIIAITESFVPIFFGEGYEKVVMLINIISPTIVLTGLTTVIGTQYLLPTKRQKDYTISIVAGLIINIVLNYILISVYKSVGASIATVVSQLVVVAVEIHMIKHEIKASEVITLMWNYLFAGAVMFAVCLILALCANSGLHLMVMQIIIGIIVYGIMLLLMKDKFVFYIINRIKIMITGRKSGEKI